MQRAASGGSATTQATPRVNAICAVAYMAFYVLLPVMRCRHPCPLRNLDKVAVLQRITSGLYSDRRYAMSPLSSRYDLPSAGSAESKNAIAFAFLSISISA